MMPPVQLYRARYLVPIAAPVIEDGALLISSGRIVDIGPYAQLRSAADEIIDCGDSVLLPPLVNAHCHLELTDFPDWSRECGEWEEPPTFVDWIQRIRRVRTALGTKRNTASIERGICQLLAAGTGAIGDIVSWLPGADLVAASPLYGRLFFESIGLTPERYRPLLDDAREKIKTLPAHFTGGLSPHAPYTVSATHLQDAIDHELPMAIHCAESKEELAFVHASSGALAKILYLAAGWTDLLPRPSGLTPVAWLDNHGALTPKTLLVHGVQVNESDAALIAARGSSVVLCPRSNARLGVGTAPALLYQQNRIHLALGTDSLASNDSLSLWDELAFAATVYPEFSAVDLLTIATIGGARALGLGREMGRLAAGYGGHWQKLTAATLPPVGELYDWLISGEHRVEALWLNGVERFRQGAPCQISAQSL